MVHTRHASRMVALVTALVAGTSVPAMPPKASSRTSPPLVYAQKPPAQAAAETATPEPPAVGARGRYILTRASFSPSNSELTTHTSDAVVSGDGNEVIFNGNGDGYLGAIFFHDMTLGSTTYVTISGGALTGSRLSLSDSGRHLARSWLNGVYIVDRDFDNDGIFNETHANGMAFLSATVSTAGAMADRPSNNPHLSPTGRHIAFESFATNLVVGDTNGNVTFSGIGNDIFVRDRDFDNDGVFDEFHSNGSRTVRVSVATDGGQANGNCQRPRMSADPRFVVFESSATNLVPEDSNGALDVFLRDRDTDADGVLDEPGAVLTQRLSVTASGDEGDGPSGLADLSGDGRYVVFSSAATNFAPGDANGLADVFLIDRAAGELRCVSATASGSTGNGASYRPRVSRDGRSVVFQTAATNLVSGDTNRAIDVVLYDRDADRDGLFDEAGETTMIRLSQAEDGTPADFGGCQPVISADGLSFVFSSQSTNLVPGDTNLRRDVYVARAVE